jgi:DHA1 family multidrug resistance protein-like MFS transporter
MDVVFFLAGAIAVAACLPVLAGGVVARTDTEYTASNRMSNRGLPRLNRSLLGALFTASALGLTIGVYESCWTLLLESHHAQDWQVGLSWTLFAVPFVAMARPAGWLADHADRRWLVIGSLASSVFFCSLYPFVTNLSLLLALGGLEAVGLAVALPSAQSLLTQSSAEGELGRVQGLFSTSETAAIAVSAGVAGALFSLTTWAPFVAGAAGAGALTACLPFIWWRVAGRARNVAALDKTAAADGAIFSEA